MDFRPPPNNAEGISLQGVEPEAEDAVMRINEDVVEGSFLSLVHARYGIVLGDKLAENLGVQLVDRVNAVFPDS